MASAIEKQILGSSGQITIGSTDLINSSSSVTGQGLVMFTQASNTGQYARFTNAGPDRAWCGQGTNTSTLTMGGQLLVSSSTGRGDNTWEIRGMQGAFSCWSEGTALIGFTYSGR